MKKLFLALIGIMLVGCSIKEQDILEDLEIKEMKVEYDTENVQNVRLLDVKEDNAYYLKVFSNYSNMEVIEYNKQDGEKLILEKEDEVVDTFIEHKENYYYTTHILEEDKTNSTTKIYSMVDGEETLISEAYGELSDYTKVVKYKDEIYILIENAVFLENIEVHEHEVYLYDLSKNYVIEKVELNDEDTLMKINDPVSAGDKLTFSVVRQTGQDVSTELYSYDGNEVKMTPYNHIAISQSYMINNNIIFNYSVMSGEFMTRKLAYTSDSKTVQKSDIELEYFDKITEAKDGMIIYGALGGHSDPVSFNYLRIKGDEITVKVINPFKNKYNLKLRSSFVASDELEKGEINIEYIQFE